MKIKVTNATRSVVSLPNGAVLGIGAFAYITITAEAFTAVREGADISQLNKQAQQDALLFEVLARMQAAGQVIIEPIEGSGGMQIVTSLASLTGGTYPDELKASFTDLLSFVATKEGAIMNAGLFLQSTGIDASNPLVCELDVEINDVSIFRTKPSLSNSATGAQASTFVAGYGAVVGVIDSEKALLNVGDVVTFDLALTRTASPSQEMAGATVIMEIE